MIEGEFLGTVSCQKVRFNFYCEVPNLQANNAVSLHSFFVNVGNEGLISDGAMYEKAIQSFSKSCRSQSVKLTDINEQSVRLWIDGALQKLSASTLLRYVESLGKIYDLAVRQQLAPQNSVFASAREYLIGLCGEGLDKRSRRLVNSVRTLSGMHFTSAPAISMAVDILLFAFYNAGMPIENVIGLHVDDAVCDIPQIDVIKNKYTAVGRKYMFPLRQWQRTTNQIKISLESNLKTVFRAYKLQPCYSAFNEFVATAWVAAAKECGVSMCDICACCPSGLDAAKLSIIPSDLTQHKVNDIMRNVANTIVDMNRYWYAIRFIGKVEVVSKEIARLGLSDAISTYYPIEEICRKIGKKRVVENRPTIRNILFVRTTHDALCTLVKRKSNDSRFYVFRSASSTDNNFAVIPNDQMRSFSVLVSNGLDILGDDDLQQVDIVEGSYVQITEGIYKGYCGQVIKARNDDNSRVTMLKIAADKFGPELCQILGKHIYITIPQDLVTCVTPIDADVR